jgi:phosphoglycolate phosphatase
MRFRTVLFDLDGTLIDHLRAIHRSYCHTLPQLGYPVPSFEEVRRAIGGGLENAMRKFVPEERLQEGLAIYRPYWDATMLQDPELMPGALELLKWLEEQQVVCGVFTNKHGPSGRKVCDHLGVSAFFRGNFGAKDTPWIKPQPEFCEYVLQKLGAEAQSTLMIGDSPFDVEAARNGKLAACWCVATGTHGTTELKAAGADTVVPDLYAVLSQLKHES